MWDESPLNLSGEQESSSSSGSQFQGSSKSVEIGEKLTETLNMIYMHPIYLQSRYAREQALVVSCAASLGFITNLTLSGMVTNQWRVTKAGLAYLTHNH